MVTNWDGLDAKAFAGIYNSNWVCSAVLPPASNQGRLGYTKDEFDSNHMNMAIVMGYFILLKYLQYIVMVAFRFLYFLLDTSSSTDPQIPLCRGGIEPRGCCNIFIGSQMIKLIGSISSTLG